MEAALSKRVIVLSGVPEDAGPIVAALRAGGHRVRYVSDIQTARGVMAAGGADMLLCDDVISPAPRVDASGDRIDPRAAVAIVAHELRDLAGVLTQTVTELSERVSISRESDAAETLARAARRLAKSREFLADLLAEVEDAPAGELRAAEVDLEELVDGAAVIAYNDAWHREQRLVVNIDDDAARVWADPPKLKRLLASLLVHVVRDTPVAGTIAVEAWRAGADCLITVMGHDERPPPREGAPFLQAPSSSDVVIGGADPELDTAQRLVEQHGGRIWTESRPGQPMVVSVLLPQPAPRAARRARDEGIIQNGEEAGA